MTWEFPSFGDFRVQTQVRNAQVWPAAISAATSSVADPKWQNIIDFNNLKINPPRTALKPTLWHLFQYITAY